MLLASGPGLPPGGGARARPRRFAVRDSPLRPQAVRQGDRLSLLGQRNREYLQHYGVPYERMFSVPHFVDNEWFRAGAEMARKQKAEIRKEWGATNGTLIALFAGKFTPKKRPGDLLESLARLRLGGQHAIAVFVGAGELEPNLRQNAARLRVVARFEGFRNQTELPARYASADTLVLPSDGGETWGLVVNEAMACGLPAIVSQAVGCAPDLIEEGRTGFTFPLGDVSALAGRLSQMHNLRREGWDFASHLRRKLAAYTVEAAAQGTLRAAQQSAARLVQFSQNKLSS
jgi:glycosyltransferase involved in cell wall biosynthesis